MKFNFLRLASLCIFGLVLASCAPPYTRAQFAKNMRALEGKNINEIIRSWGYPESRTTSPNGNEVYVYEDKSTYYVPKTSVADSYKSIFGTNVTTTSTYGGYSTTKSCTIYVEFDAENIVQAISFKGDLCKAPEERN